MTEYYVLSEDYYIIVIYGDNYNNEYIFLRDDSIVDGIEMLENNSIDYPKIMNIFSKNENIKSTFNLAMLNYMLGCNELALTYLKYIKDYEYSCSFRSLIYYEEEKYKKQKKYAKKGLKMGETYSMLSLGKYYLKMNKLDKCKEYLDLALSYGNKSVNYYLGKYYIKNKYDYNNAKLCLNEGLYHNDIRCHQVLGKLYKLDSNYKEMEYHYNLSINYGCTKYIKILGKFYEKNGNIAKALNYYLLGFNKKLEYPTFNYIVLLFYSKDYKKFLYYVEKYLEFGENEIIIGYVYQLLGLYYYTNYKYKLSIEYYNESIKYENYNAFICLAKYYEHIEDYDKAKELYDLAISKNVTIAFYKCATMLSNIQNYSQALTYYYDFIDESNDLQAFWGKNFKEVSYDCKYVKTFKDIVKIYNIIGINNEENGFKILKKIKIPEKLKISILDSELKDINIVFNYLILINNLEILNDIINKKNIYELYEKYHKYLNKDNLIIYNFINILQSNKSECNICTDNDNCVELLCHNSHIICKNCILKINYCPYCRKPLELE